MEEINYKELIEDFLHEMKEVTEFDRGLSHQEELLFKHLELVNVPDMDDNEGAVFLQANVKGKMFRLVYANYEREDGLYLDEAPIEVYERIFNLILTKGITTIADQVLLAMQSNQSQNN